MEAPGSSETSVHIIATRRNNPEDTILHSHRRENLKSYIANVVPREMIVPTLIIETICSSKIYVVTTATRRRIPRDWILHYSLSLNVPLGTLRGLHRKHRIAFCEHAVP
jgi:hypothetical protein